MSLATYPPPSLTAENLVLVAAVGVGLLLLWLLFRVLGWIGRWLLYLAWLSAAAAALFWLWTRLAGGGSV